MQWMLAACLLLGAATASADGTSARILVQSSPLAGFQYYEGKALWSRLKVGDALTLAREADNPHDPLAVRVEWNGRMLGYVPRAENEAIARQLDRGNRLEARISRLNRSRDPWKRVEFEIFIRI